jgi:hypothetical protein
MPRLRGPVEIVIEIRHIEAAAPDRANDRGQHLGTQPSKIRKVDPNSIPGYTSHRSRGHVKDE